MPKKAKAPRSIAVLDNLKPYDSAKERNLRRPFEDDFQVTGMPAAAESKDDVLVVQAPGTLHELIVRIRRADIARVVELPAIMDPLTSELIPQIRVSIRAGATFTAMRMIRSGGIPHWRASCGNDPYVELPLEPIPPPPTKYCYR